jgi:hypothetical protein
MTIPTTMTESAYVNYRDVPWTQSERYYCAYGANMNKGATSDLVASSPCRSPWRSFLTIGLLFTAIPKRGTGPWRPSFRLRARKSEA